MRFVCAGMLFLVSFSPAAERTAPQGMPERVKPYLEKALAEGSAFVVVSAAGGMPLIAPGSLASAFGPSLAAQTAMAAAPYPTSLGGISLQVVDSAGVSRAASLLYVSPSQVDFVVPDATAAGAVTINIVNGTGIVPSSSATVQTVAPQLFTANQNGQGVVAATAVLTIAPSSVGSPIPVFQCGGAGTCVSVPLEIGIDTPILVTFYASGIRHRSSDAAVSVVIAGQTIRARSVTSLDDSSAAPGVDLVTIALPLSLRGSGESDVVLAVDDVMSNTARINVQ